MDFNTRDNKELVGTGIVIAVPFAIGYGIYLGGKYLYKKIIGKKTENVAYDKEEMRAKLDEVLQRTFDSYAGRITPNRLKMLVYNQKIDFRSFGHKNVTEFIFDVYGDEVELITLERGTKQIKYVQFKKYAQSESEQSAERQEYSKKPKAKNNTPIDNEPVTINRIVDFAWFPYHKGVESGWKLAMKRLSEMAINEPWSWDGTEGDFGILTQYLYMTFEQLQYEDTINRRNKAWRNKISVKNNKHIFVYGREKQKVYPPQTAVFNTGLVNSQYEPIYAVFITNEMPEKNPWKFWKFVDHNDNATYQALIRAYGSDLPETAQYNSDSSEIIFDIKKEIAAINWEHLMERCYRMPVEFLKKNGLTDFDFSVLDSEMNKHEIATTVFQAVKQHKDVYERIRVSLEIAMNNAVKRARYDTKTVVPIYHPAHKQISLLLPLALADGETIDTALILENTNSNAYIAHTLLTLEMAYSNARLLGKVNSDWLKIKEK